MPQLQILQLSLAPYQPALLPVVGGLANLLFDFSYFCNCAGDSRLKLCVGHGHGGHLGNKQNPNEYRALFYLLFF